LLTELLLKKSIPDERFSLIHHSENVLLTGSLLQETLGGHSRSISLLFLAGTVDYRQLGLYLRRKDTSAGLHAASLPLPTRIKSRGYNGQLNMRIGQRNSGFLYFGVTRLGYSQGGIPRTGLQGRLAKQSSITLTVLNHGIKGRLDGCFGGQYQANTGSTEDCFGRRIGKKSMLVPTQALLFLLFKKSYSNTPTFNFSKTTQKGTLHNLQSLFSR
jgi:hypothetical protein